MKKYMLVLFLLAGLSNFSFAQGRHNRKKNGLEINKKVEPRKQVFHFEKRPKDKKMVSNGTSYKKSTAYSNPDGDGFRSFDGIKKNKKFVSESAAKRKQYQKQLRKSVYARNDQGRSLRKQMFYGSK